MNARKMPLTPTLSPQAAGLSHLAEHAEQEGIVPASPLDLLAHGYAAGVDAKDIDSKPSQDGEVLRGIVLPGPIAVLVEDDVENPMQLILDRPVAARDLQQPLGWNLDWTRLR